MKDNLPADGHQSRRHLKLNEGMDMESDVSESRGCWTPFSHLISPAVPPKLPANLTFERHLISAVPFGDQHAYKFRILVISYLPL